MNRGGCEQVTTQEEFGALQLGAKAVFPQQWQSN